MAIAYIALGSNQSNPEQQLLTALMALQQLPYSRLIKQSGFYQNPAIGPGQQADYLNAVIKLDTGLEPLALLQALQAIEDQQGRKRDIRWGARTLDLDIILYDQQAIKTEQLTLPHPRALERNFVMRPLYEIAPDLLWPNGECIKNFPACHNSQQLQRLERQP